MFCHPKSSIKENSAALDIHRYGGNGFELELIRPKGNGPNEALQEQERCIR